MAVTQASDTSSKTSYSIPTPNVGHSATVWMLKILPVSGKPEVLISDVGDLPQGSKLVQKRSPGIRSAKTAKNGHRRLLPAKPEVEIWRKPQKMNSQVCYRLPIRLPILYGVYLDAIWPFSCETLLKGPL